MNDRYIPESLPIIGLPKWFSCCKCEHCEKLRDQCGDEWDACICCGTAIGINVKRLQERLYNESMCEPCELKLDNDIKERKRLEDLSHQQSYQKED